LSALLLGLLFSWLWWRLLRAWRRWRLRRQGRRARRGERDAEGLLEALGYRVLERQARQRWTLWVDEEELEVELRADLLVERDGQLWVAEVKTGKFAPLLTTAATRRQLLEYAFAYDCDGVLLVDMERGECRALRFEAHRKD
jgi:hypothetical protein